MLHWNLLILSPVSIAGFEVKTMNLMQMLITMILFNVGLCFGYLYIPIFGELGVYLGFPTGFLSVFLFAWPIFKKFSYFPLLLPKCPNCNQKNYWLYSSKSYDGIVYLKCGNCQQILEWDYYNDFIKEMDIDGNYKTSYKIIWPQLLFILKRANNSA